MPFLTRCFALLVFCLAVPLTASADFHNSISLEGYTGLLNTPNALTTDEGRIYLSYSDQKEPEWRTKTSHQDNYMVSLGFFDFLELGGRLVEAPKKARDLSGSFKLRIPFIPKGELIPQVAVGIQDIGGGSKYLQTGYVVASDEIWRLRLSAGYGTGPDRMKGLFGGVELRAWDWLYLLAEHDTKDPNVGLRLVTPSLFGYPVNLQGTLKTSLDHDPGHPAFAVALQFPLGFDHNNTKPIALPSPPGAGQPAALWKAPTPQPTATPHAAATPQVAAAASAQTVDQPAEVTAALQRLLKTLTKEGFQNVRVGSAGTTLVVEYENARYNHNELDAFGVVAGLAQVAAPPSFDTLRLVEKKKQIGLLQLEMPLQELRDFLADPGHLERFRSELKISHEVSNSEGTSFVPGDENSSLLHASLLLYPGLLTYVGTEVGVFDYLLSLKTDLYLNLWKGAVVDARADIPVSWSSNFDNGEPFRSQRHDPRLDRLMIFQALKPAPSLMAVLGAGMVLAENYGTANELVWTPGEGNHQVKLLQVYARESGNDVVSEEYLGSYRYFFAPLDLNLQGTGGKFLTGDKGFVGELRRYFGDTAVTVYYKNSTMTDGHNVQVGGIQFDLPLTPRRDMKPYLMQVRGSDDWSYAQETTLVTKGHSNNVGVPVGMRLEPPYNVDRVFYNRDRLSDDYIREHLLRLRDAYRRYVKQPSDQEPI